MRRALAGTLALLSLTTPGCFGDDDDPQGDARAGGSVMLALAAPVKTLDPARVSSPATREFLPLVYTPPLTYRRASGAGGTTLEPGLATALPRVTDGGRTYTFRFRRGLRYSDGRPLRASDFKRAVERAHDQRLYAGIARIAADDRTAKVTLTLRRPDGEFANVLAATSSAPTSSRGAGIGPYSVARLGSGRLVLERNRRFHLRGVPGGNLDFIRTIVVPNANARARAVASERDDLAADPPPTGLLPELRSKYSDRFSEHPELDLTAFVVDPQRRPFDSGDVRRAAGLAFDRAKLKRVLSDRIALSCNALPPSVPGYHRTSPCPVGDPSAPPDLLRASQLVKDAKGRGKRVVLVAPRTGRDHVIAGAFAAGLRKVGLRVRVRPPARRVRANVALVHVAGALPYPSSLLRPLIADPRFRDPELESRFARLAASQPGKVVLDDFGALDRDLVQRAEVIPVGNGLGSTFLSGRVDARNCALFHPVYGNDLSSFCLR